MNANLPSFHHIPGPGQALRALGIGGVPTVGYFGADWSMGTVLLLYWIETLLVILSVAVLARRHRTLTDHPGHGGGKEGSPLHGLLWLMTVITLGFGVLIVVLVAQGFAEMVGPNARISPRALGIGTVSLAACVLAGLLVDLHRLDERPLGWLFQHAARAEHRMVVTFMTLLSGAAAITATDSPLAFMTGLVLFKALADLALILSDEDPKEETREASR